MPSAAGTLVRLVTDPGKEGTVTGKKRSRGGYRFYQVRFSDGTKYQREDELEEVAAELDPWDLLEDNWYGTASELRRSLIHIQLTGRLANLVYSMEATNTEIMRTSSSRFCRFWTRRPTAFSSRMKWVWARPSKRAWCGRSCGRGLMHAGCSSFAPPC